MRLLNKLVHYMNNRQKKRALRNIRESFAFFGCDLSQVTDEDIEQSLLETSHQIVEPQIGSEETTASLYKLQQFLKPVPELTDSEEDGNNKNN